MVSSWCSLERNVGLLRTDFYDSYQLHLKHLYSPSKFRQITVFLSPIRFSLCTDCGSSEKIGSSSLERKKMATCYPGSTVWDFISHYAIRGHASVCFDLGAEVGLKCVLDFPKGSLAGKDVGKKGFCITNWILDKRMSVLACCFLNVLVMNCVCALILLCNCPVALWSLVILWPQV